MKRERVVVGSIDRVNGEARDFRATLLKRRERGRIRRERRDFQEHASANSACHLSVLCVSKRLMTVGLHKLSAKSKVTA